MVCHLVKSSEPLLWWHAKNGVSKSFPVWKWRINSEAIGLEAFDVHQVSNIWSKVCLGGWWKVESCYFSQELCISFHKTWQLFSLFSWNLSQVILKITLDNGKIHKKWPNSKFYLFDYFLDGIIYLEHKFDYFCGIWTQLFAQFTFNTTIFHEMKLRFGNFTLNFHINCHFNSFSKWPSSSDVTVVTNRIHVSHCKDIVVALFWPCLLPEQQLIVHIECKYLSHHLHYQQPHFIGTIIPLSSGFLLFFASTCHVLSHVGMDTPFIMD